MKKYDIGILTFWNVPNYGTFAQAYALQKTLEMIAPGKKVVQISHLDDLHYSFYYDKKKYFRKYRPWKKAFWKSFLVKNNSGREKLFLNAYDLIPHTETITQTNSNDYEFEKVILGSDIVWDYSIEAFNNDHMLFGGGIKGEINSYAASFGTVKENDIIPTYVRESIKAMNHISVRDENSAKIVEKLVGYRPEIDLDPVWLWDFRSDSNIVVPKQEDYLLVYGQDFTEKFIENIRKYANKNSLKIVALDCNNDSYSWCDYLVKQEELTPFEWIGYFMGANAIATSTFHGLTFGLLFNKKIAFCKTEFIMAKIEVLLEELGILELYKNVDDVEGMLDYNWNYVTINQIISEKKNRSLDYLKKVCNE